MGRWTIIGYAECEGTYYLPRKEKVVQAPNKREAERIAMREFPEYHEIGAFELEQLSDKRTEITAEPIQCDECGSWMKAMWERTADGCIRSTVFHCENCDADRELLRHIDDEGNEVSRSVIRYFFG